MIAVHQPPIIRTTWVTAGTMTYSWHPEIQGNKDKEVAPNLPAAKFTEKRAVLNCQTMSDYVRLCQTSHDFTRLHTCIPAAFLYRLYSLYSLYSLSGQSTARVTEMNNLSRQRHPTTLSISQPTHNSPRPWRFSPRAAHKCIALQYLKTIALFLVTVVIQCFQTFAFLGPFGLLGPISSSGLSGAGITSGAVEELLHRALHNALFLVCRQFHWSDFALRHSKVQISVTVWIEN